MEVLSSRVLLRPADLERSQAFYRDTLGLAVYREFGPPEHRGVVFFLGNGLLEVSGRAVGRPSGRRCGCRCATSPPSTTASPPAGVTAHPQAPRQEPWGLVEMSIDDPDGLRIVLVEVPDDHPLRRDQR